MIEPYGQSGRAAYALAGAPAWMAGHVVLQLALGGRLVVVVPWLALGASLVLGWPATAVSACLPSRC